MASDRLRERLAALFDRRPTLGQSRADEAVAIVAEWLRGEAAKRDKQAGETDDWDVKRYLATEALAIEELARSLAGEQTTEGE